MKYINSKRHGIIIFPESLIHREVAVGLRIDPDFGLVSAGFIRVFITDDIHLECHGTSDSLRLGSRFEDDNKLLMKQLVNGAHKEPTFQEKVRVWTRMCFGQELANDLQERNRRFLETALKLVKACGFSREGAHAMVDYIFDRDVGDKVQRVGGVEVTLSALCNAHEIDQIQTREAELERIRGSVEEIREKHDKKPIFD